MLEFHCVPFFKSADINQAFGICAEWGKSQFHKGKAAGAGKNEQAEGLLCCPPTRSGVQTKASSEKKEQAQPNAFGTHWECACRGAGKRATGHTPARQEAEGEPGAKLPYKGAGVRGGGASLTNPHWP